MTEDVTGIAPRSPAHRVLLVDWLGQGGIFQTSRVWTSVLDREGCEVTLLARRGGEGGATLEVGTRLGKVASHALVARAAAAFIREHRPDAVIVQNYIIPTLEEPVYRAARECHAKLITIVHDHRPHSRVSGTRLGLRTLLRSADLLVAHSQFVAHGVETFTARNDVVVMPLPLPLAMIELAPQQVPSPEGDAFTAVHFGVLTRQYKGMSVVLDLARLGVPSWEFVIMGVGAPAEAPHARTIPGFIPAAQLVGAVQSADACLLPYRWATQSAAVLLAQALGTVPVANAVGAIPEQIVDGETGFLLAPAAPIEAWQSLLREMSDRERLDTLGEKARGAARQQQQRFETMAAQLMKS